MTTIPKPNLPAGWRWQPLDSIAAVSVSTVDKKSYDDEPPVRLCNYTDVYYSDNITADIDFMNATASSAQIRQFSVRAGDVPITKDSESSDDIGRPSFVPHDLPGVVYGYHLAIYRPFDPGFSRFLYYLFESAHIRAELQARTPGVTRVGLSQNTLRNLRVPLPERSEAKEIADYLDHETAEIDALLSDLDALSKLLAEHRTLSIEGSFAAISDRSPRLRDLGVKKASGYSANGGATAALTHELGVLKTGSVSKGYFDSSENKVVDEHSEISKLCTPVTKGTVIVNRANTPALVGAAGYVSENHENLFVSDLLWELTLPNQLSEVFYFYTLTRQYREQIDLISVGASSTMKKIRFDDLSRMRVPFPHDSLVGSFLDEQRIIVERHAELHEEIVRSMDLAKERRMALISAAVTGQIDATGRRRGPSDAERLESDLARTQ
ncbi:restriction endonuclease subunit S [Citricoccus nitrophenolicus]|uniref:restriction endonuclease subunit S n=1 Tax=Citricoccus nitrophenolicus TaxID=863575 RepID=UPI0031EA9295